VGASEQRVDLVFEGGGVKGIALAGAFAELEARGFRPQCVAGTSAGAITAALVAAGYSGVEVERIVTQEMHFPSFEDPPRLHEFGALGDAMDIAKRKGMHSGAYFLAWIQEKLSAKGLTKFGQLKDAETGDEKRRYRLQVIASDLSEHSMLVLPRDAPRLGLDPDELLVADAVRMSMSIPIFFEPVIHQNPQSGGQHMIVDGGLLSNFPVWLFDCTPLKPSFPTFGVQLVAPPKPVSDAQAQGAAPPALPSFIDYLKSLADTATQAHDRFYLEDEDFARTIAVSTLGVRTTDFQITEDRVAALIQSGHDATDKFLATWNFEAWVETYRTGVRPAVTIG
jgi:NTE family protein